MGVLVKVVETIASVLVGTVICEIVLTNRCGGGSVNIWLICNGKGVGPDTTMDWGLWCKCNCLVKNQFDTNQVIMGKSCPKIIGQSRCSQTMNICLNFFRNSSMQVVVPRRPRLLPLVSFTLYVCVCFSIGLGSSLSKHAFDIQEMVMPGSNKDIF